MSIADEEKKGRDKHPKHEDHANSKLTWTDVHKIRRLNDEGVSHQDIAKLFPTTKRNITFICEYETWKPERCPENMTPACPVYKWPESCDQCSDGPNDKCSTGCPNFGGGK